MRTPEEWVDEVADWMRTTLGIDVTSKEDIDWTLECEAELRKLIIKIQQDAQEKQSL